LELITGYIEHIIYRNSENGYTVLNMVSGGEDIICVGTFRTMDQGECIEAEGEYVNNAVYGTQFKIDHYKIVPPTDAASVERYLASGAIKGIGVSLATRIVKKFGDDTFRIMEQEPERLVEIKGISERKAREIAEQLVEKKRYERNNDLSPKIWNIQYIGD